MMLVNLDMVQTFPTNNFLQIALTSHCNLSCWHCPMAQYRNTGTPEFALTNKRLIPWLRKNADPKVWVVELTGGEPSLYKGIDELCEWLSMNGYRTLVKTNGLLEIKPQPNVRRIAAFHQLDNPPKFFDEILIIDKIDREKKEEVCKANGWKYQVIGYETERIDDVWHQFRLTAYMDPHGHPIPCKNRPVKYTEWPDQYALEFTGLKSTMCCPDCKAATDAWRFMPESWKMK